MSESKDTEIRSKYDDLTVEELTKELKNVFFCSSPITGKEVSEMEQILVVLQKKSPLPDVYSGRELWERFQEVHGDEVAKLGIRNTEEVVKKEAEAASVKRPDAAVVTPVKAPAPVKERGFRKLLHTALIAAAVVAVMVIVTVSASAVGINIWGWVPVRGAGTLQFVTEETAAEQMDIPTALKQLGIEEPLYPTWIPEGFILHELKMHLDSPRSIYISYLYKSRSISLSIREVSDRTKAGIIEVDDIKTLEYEKNGTVFYMVSNFDALTCSWLIENYLITCIGDISKEEMERMIDSIYEVIE